MFNPKNALAQMLTLIPSTPIGNYNNYTIVKVLSDDDGLRVYILWGTRNKIISGFNNTTTQHGNNNNVQRSPHELRSVLTQFLTGTFIHHESELRG